MTTLRPESAAVYLPTVSGRGGAERLGVVMAIEQARMGIATKIFTHSAMAEARLEADLGETVRSVDIVTVPDPNATPGPFQSLRDIPAVRACARRIKDHRPDLFINCDYKSKVPGCGRRNVLYCHFPHELTIPTQSSRLSRLYHTSIEALERILVYGGSTDVVATYDAVWANSKFTRRHVARMWRRTADVLYPPCEMTQPREKTRQIIAVGRFQREGGATTPHKSQLFLIDAFRQLTDLHDAGWQLALVGAAEDEDQDFVAALKRRASGLPVTFQLNPTRAELTRSVSESMIFWHAQGVEGDAERHPETQEHFGIVTVEAMSAGAIPLVFGRAGPAEVVIPAGAVQPWQTSAELLDATRAIASLDDERRSAMARRCIERAHDFDRNHFRAALSGLVGPQPEPLVVR